MTRWQSEVAHLIGGALLGTLVTMTTVSALIVRPLRAEMTKQAPDVEFCMAKYRKIQEWQYDTKKKSQGHCGRK